jgi:predicted SAM-dependent methyltransferase
MVAPVSGDGPKRRRMARWVRGSGIEIGALHNPLHVPKGTTVRYVDRASTEQLRVQYPELGTIVPVSILGDAHNLSSLRDGEVDFVIANHLVEHLEDPIRGLTELFRVIRAGGIIYMAIPDPRATFDRRRPPTSIEHIHAEYLNGTAETRRQHFREWVELVEPELDAHAISSSEADARIEQLIEMDYSIHFHVYRPDTFIELLCTARREVGLEFELIDFAPCNPAADDEFIFVLGKGPGIQNRVVEGADLDLAPPRRSIVRRVARRVRRQLSR